jgi:acylphosphatase
VRNLPDGRVEIEAAGEGDSLRDLVNALREGPPGARVDQIDEHAIESADQLPHPFTIIR